MVSSSRFFVLIHTQLFSVYDFSKIKLNWGFCFMRVFESLWSCSPCNQLVQLFKL